MYFEGGESNTPEFTQHKRSHKMNVLIRVIKILQIILQNRWARNYKLKIKTQVNAYSDY